MSSFIIMSEDSISKLPTEIFTLVLLHFRIPDILRCASVSKQWNIWHNMVLRRLFEHFVGVKMSPSEYISNDQRKALLCLENFKDKFHRDIALLWAAQQGNYIYLIFSFLLCSIC